MPIQNDYQRVARRSIDASIAALNANIQEKAAFLSYHAFESTGCALTIRCGLPYGRRVNHNRKIRHFINAAGRYPRNHAVIQISLSLLSLRNNYLYPLENPTTGTVTLPEQIISHAEADRLRRRVEGIIRWVDPKL